LELLDAVTGLADDRVPARAAVLRAECHTLLGDPGQAVEVLEGAIRELGPQPDFFLGLCGLQQEVDGRIAMINRALRETGLAEVHLDEEAAPSAYDRLHGEDEPDLSVQPPGMRVTVIVPAYNAEGTIGTTLRALTVQTWRELEIIVSDDCSTDATCAIVEEWAARDPRVKLIRGEANSGPYVARNKALQVATGIFVTCNDAD